MSDIPSGNAGDGLEDFYATYCAKRFPSAKTKRGKQNIANRLGLPLIRAGHNTLIDPKMGDDRLRELALHQPARRGPGRPRLR